MKKVKLYYKMLQSSDVGSESEEGSTIAVVTDNIAQRLLEGQKVGKVVCYLITLASLRGWNGGCLLLNAEELKPLTISELREKVGQPVYDSFNKLYRVIETIDDVDELSCVIYFTDDYEIDAENSDLYELLEEAPL